MPRPKPKGGSPSFAAPHVSLSIEAWTQIEKLLSRDVDPQLRRQIGAAVGLYVGGHGVIDCQPRGADYREAQTPVLRAAAKLVEKLELFDGWQIAAFNESGPSHADSLAAARAIEAAARKVLAATSDMPSRGAREEIALKEAVRRLRLIFRRCYQPKKHASKKSNLERAFDVGQEDERAFIKIVLVNARVLSSSKAVGIVNRLFLDPACSIDRGEALQRMVERKRSPASKKRTKAVP